MGADEEQGSAGSVSLAASAPEMSSASSSSPMSGSTGSAGPKFTGQVSQQVAQQALSGAQAVIRQTAGEVRLYVEQNPYSVTALSFVGGLILVFVSFVNVIFLPSFFVGPLAYMLHAYQLLFGLIICVIDGPTDRFPSLREKVLGYASFLHTNGSRALFYMFIACLLADQEGIFRQLVAWYFAGIAIGHGILSWMKPNNPPSQGSDLQEGLASGSSGP
eukprot:TRINITY_DN5427_c0_g2_i1.p1 TRINITY_DN5427_c0_g2~~TRINITY_DN5427_c0_g2_i1.p1  ORF type:complete len:218 (+),score=25.62 TRINITY_DN5427_c0_g2_i1:100-753(+)